MLRIVSKDQPSQQIFFDFALSKLPDLKPSSVRIQSHLIGLSATSIAYCGLGDQIGWWNCFPVPSQPAASYQDGSHGVGPTWGYAKIMDSTLAELKPGGYLWGYLPTSAHPVDLKLKQSTSVPQHWSEISDRRSKLQSLYNRYTVVNSSFFDSESMLAKFTAALKSTFESAFLLNHFCLSDQSDKPVHPSGDPEKSWTDEDASLSSTVVIILAAGSRTGRAFAHQLACSRSSSDQPAGVLEVTQNKKGTMYGLKPSFAHQRLSYDMLESGHCTEFLKSIDFDRVLIVDFGARGDTISLLTQEVDSNFPDKKRAVIAVGVEQEATTTDALRRKVMLGLRHQAVVFGTAAVNEAAIGIMGEQKYHQQLDDAFEGMIYSELARNEDTTNECKVLDMTLDERHGMRGSQGMEGAWNDLYSSKTDGSSAVVIHLQSDDDWHVPSSQM